MREQCAPPGLALLTGPVLEYEGLLSGFYGRVCLRRVIPALPQYDPRQPQRARNDEGPLPTQGLHCPDRKRRCDDRAKARPQHKDGHSGRTLIGGKPLRNCFTGSRKVCRLGDTQNHPQREKAPESATQGMKDGRHAPEYGC